MQHKLFFIPTIVLLCSIIVGTRRPWHFPRWPLKNLKKIPKILDIVKEIRDSSVNDVECCDSFLNLYCYTENDQCGPDGWGDFCPDCNGRNQTPIDLVPMNFIDDNDPPRFKNFQNLLTGGVGGTSILTNSGQTVEFNLTSIDEDVGLLEGGPLKGIYQFIEFHFHWGPNDTTGAEHTLNGETFPIELHIVFQKIKPKPKKQKLAVAGFFFDISDADNPDFQPFIEFLQYIPNANDSIDITDSNFRLDNLISPVAPIDDALIFSNYSTYTGSLTTPPCTEELTWINFLPILDISSNQLKQFRTLTDEYNQPITNNSRPLQKLNGRTVEFFNIIPPTS